MRISTKRERERERERERDDDSDIYINPKVYTKMTIRLKTSVEPIWFDIIPCASFYGNLRSIPEVSRMFQRNLEYTSIFYNKT